MDMLWAILPFFNAGLVAAVFARFTGVNMSMCTLMTLLYMGAKPVEAVVAMLLFNVFTYFTIYSQQHLMKLKEFYFFPGFKLAIPILVMIALTALNAFFGIVFFVAVFLLEIFAKVYFAMDKKVRPARQQLVTLCAIGSICVVAGVALVQFLPAEYYYIFAGVMILAYAFLMWRSGNRNQLTDIWDKLLYGSAFVTGLTGIDASDWFSAMRRNTPSALSRCYPIVLNTAMVIGLVVSYFLYQYFSLGSLFTSIGAAIGIRLFGLYEHSTRSHFSYLALGLTVLTVLIFMLVQPVPSGFPEVPLGVGDDAFTW